MLDKIQKFFSSAISWANPWSKKRVEAKKNSPKQLSQKEKTELHKATENQNEIRKLGKANIVSHLDAQGEALVKEQNSKNKPNYVLVLGECHSSNSPGESATSEHRLTKFLMNQFPEFKKRGFTSFAVESPVGTESAIMSSKTEDLYDSEAISKNPQVKAFVEKVESILRKYQIEKHEQDAISSLGMSKIQELRATKVEAQSGVQPEERMSILAKAAHKAGLKVKAIDAPPENNFRMSLALITVMGLAEARRSLDSKLDKEKIDRLSKAIDEISKLKSDIVSQRDKFMAQELAKLNKDGKVLALVGALHATNKQVYPEFKDPTAVELLKGPQHQVPVLNLLAENRGLYDRINKLSLDYGKDEKMIASLSNIVDTETLDQNLVFDTKSSPDIAEQSFLKSAAQKAKYGDQFHSVITLAA